MDNLRSGQCGSLPGDMRGRSSMPHLRLSSDILGYPTHRILCMPPAEYGFTAVCFLLPYVFLGALSKPLNTPNTWNLETTS